MSLFRNTLALAAAAALSFTFAPSTAQADDWVIDKAHTDVGFKVRHLAISWVRGDFEDVDAKISWNDGDLESLKAEVTIDVGTIDTENQKRDEHLRSPDFFDAPNHPKMTFVSKRVENISKDGTSFDLVGDLSIRGTTKPVTLKVTDWVAGVSDPWGNTKAGATATATINRTEFGLTWNKALETGGVLVGEDVVIEIQLELNKAK